jgi:hypothetical protein
MANRRQAFERCKNSGIIPHLALKLSQRGEIDLRLVQTMANLHVKSKAQFTPKNNKFYHWNPGTPKWAVASNRNEGQRKLNLLEIRTSIFISLKARYKRYGKL